MELESYYTLTEAIGDKLSRLLELIAKEVESDE